jgi:hypothetical protein
MYFLSKESTPSWTFYADDLSVILKQLEPCICEDCWEYETLFAAQPYIELDTKDKINALLATSCGCQYYFGEDYAQA